MWGGISAARPARALVYVRASIHPCVGERLRLGTDEVDATTVQVANEVDSPRAFEEQEERQEEED